MTQTTQQLNTISTFSASVLSACLFSVFQRNLQVCFSTPPKFSLRSCFNFLLSMIQMPQTHLVLGWKLGRSGARVELDLLLSLKDQSFKNCLSNGKGFGGLPGLLGDPSANNFWELQHFISNLCGNIFWKMNNLYLSK